MKIQLHPSCPQLVKIAVVLNRLQRGGSTSHGSALRLKLLNLEDEVQLHLFAPHSAGFPRFGSPPTTASAMVSRSAEEMLSTFLRAGILLLVFLAAFEMDQV